MTDPALPRTTLYLIRHGHIGDRAHVMAGSTDLRLSPRGVAQAAALARWLEKWLRATALYSSPLSRARRTAEAVDRRLRTGILLEDGLREIDCGLVDGMRSADVERLYPELWAKNLRQDDPGFRWPGGESYAELRARSLRTLARIARVHPGGRVAVVTHTGVISEAVGAINGAGAAEWSRFRPGHCSVTELEWSDDGPVLLRFDVRPESVRAAA